MTVEQRLAETLRSNDQYAPSADLFAKVTRSISEDIAHRRRIRRLVGAIIAGIAAVAVYVVAFLEVGDGRAEMPWWALEVLAGIVMVVLVGSMGPLIRRFGSTYVGDVFRSHPATGGHFLRLLDIAYYLVFSAYILMTSTFSPPTGWARLAEQLEFEMARIGGLLLLMGVLHVATVGALTVVGLVFAANQRRAFRAAVPGVDAPNPIAERIDRVLTILVWGATLLLVGGVLLIVVLALIGLGGS